MDVGVARLARTRLPRAPDDWRTVGDGADRCPAPLLISSLLQTGSAAPDTSVGATCTTGADGVCTATVPLGSYYWEEAKAPDRWEHSHS